MFTKEEALSQIAALVESFHEQLASYKKSEYNETLTRKDFIDPFFTALGWDMNNSAGNAEAYREVIHEDKIKIGSATKAPDYSFRLPGGKRLFFVEAKKPSVHVKDEILPAYQVRRYAWSAKLPVSILTDFEEFAVYDCKRKPNITDKAGTSRIKYITYKDYLTEFDFIWNNFSKEKVLKGGFDKYVNSDSNKKGTSTVDKEFLVSLDEWRKELAQNIALRNTQLNEDDINFAVQQTLDRLIFLRIAEDRGVEEYGRLTKSLTGDVYYQNLFKYFKEADSKYNSGLFDFKKDTLSAGLVLDNKTIKKILNELYYPASPYEFSVLSVEILGSAYEQFLGKQIRLTPAHKAVIEEKPEVRKAGGVYYTPEYIVEYIVKNTGGKLTEGLNPKQIEAIKIVDPACGSGSFLIGAYQYLLNFHQEYYKPKFEELSTIAASNEYNTKQRNDAIKEKKLLPLTPDGHLTTSLKKQILLNNIFGVDIDAQAVEVTKLSLMLKCMEGETRSSINAQMTFGERILPTLDDNIKCGNSLIGVDFFDGMLDLEPGIEKKVKPFSWENAFPKVFRVKKQPKNQDLFNQYYKVKKLEKDANDLIEKYTASEPEAFYGKIVGFDIIIGNPPYGAFFSPDEINYFKNKFRTAVWRGESYLMFIEQGLKLLKPGGLLSYIIPDTLLNLKFTQPAREMLLRNSVLQEIVGLPSNVFSGATVDTIILRTEKTEYTNKFHQSNVWIKMFGKKQVIQSVESPQKEFYIKAKDWFEQDTFNLQMDNTEKALVIKIELGKKKLDEFGLMYSGIKSYEVGKGNPAQTKRTRDEKPFTSVHRTDQNWLPFYDGKHIGRYELFWKNNNWIKYGDWLAAPRKPENFKDEKILIRKITGKTLIATFIPETAYCNTLLHVLKLNDKSYSYKSILAILNASLIGWYFRKKFQIGDDDTFPQIMIRDILQFPIPVIDKKKDEQLNKLVNTLLQLQKEKQQTTLPDKLKQLETRIQYTDDIINKLVYELYGLSEAEIGIVEGV
ncbi:MAG: N-6 DNA methylase [Ginsengibacter sp.]